MNETTVNIPLLRKAVEWAEAEAQKPYADCAWHQAAYVLPKEIASGAGKSRDCGTCYCIAGYVASLVDPGYEYVNDMAAPAIALEALGLDAYGDRGLFAPNNTIEDVRRIAEEIAGERL